VIIPNTRVFPVPDLDWMTISVGTENSIRFKFEDGDIPTFTFATYSNRYTFKLNWRGFTISRLLQTGKNGLRQVHVRKQNLGMCIDIFSSFFLIEDVSRFGRHVRATNVFSLRTPGRQHISKLKS